MTNQPSTNDRTERERHENVRANNTDTFANYPHQPYQPHQPLTTAGGHPIHPTQLNADSTPSTVDGRQAEHILQALIRQVALDEPRLYWAQRWSETNHPDEITAWLSSLIDAGWNPTWTREPIDQAEPSTPLATDCDTCNGLGTFDVEGQIGAPGTGGTIPCPDCTDRRPIATGRGGGPAHQGSVDHPAHYNAHPSGVECIDVVEHMGFNLGNAMKYIWRADEKGNALEDLEKAAWYVRREIGRRSAGAS